MDLAQLAGGLYGQYLREDGFMQGEGSPGLRIARLGHFYLDFDFYRDVRIYGSGYLDSISWRLTRGLPLYTLPLVREVVFALRLWLGLGGPALRVASIECLGSICDAESSDEATEFLFGVLKKSRRGEHLVTNPGAAAAAAIAVARIGRTANSAHVFDELLAKWCDMLMLSDLLMPYMGATSVFRMLSRQRSPRTATLLASIAQNLPPEVVNEKLERAWQSSTARGYVFEVLTRYHELISADTPWSKLEDGLRSNLPEELRLFLYFAGRLSGKGALPEKLHPVLEISLGHSHEAIRQAAWQILVRSNAARGVWRTRPGDTD
jgi:hypothetical protein